jgi:formyltetrahydrofolate deformylase
MADLGSRAERGADHTARLLISCPDGPGIVAAVSRFLFEQGANIVSSDQHSSDPEGGSFFMRCAFYLPAIDEDRAAFEAAFGEVAESFAMRWRIAYAGDRRRVALMASREDHCLLDLLWRNRRGELDMDVLCVISNHEDARAEVEALGVPFRHIPVTREIRQAAEAQVLDALAGRVELLVLARYMQILPAFAGAQPYRHAYERGVKLIGATAHYVTEQLDEGPIIEQDVQRVGHRYTVADLERVGRDLERLVLARAVRSELDDRVLVHEGRTIVF